jgi:hypothetical protein
MMLDKRMGDLVDAAFCGWLLHRNGLLMQLVLRVHRSLLSPASDITLSNPVPRRPLTINIPAAWQSVTGSVQA